VVERFGQTAGFLSVTAVGLIAVAIVVAFMPETKPSTAATENLKGNVRAALAGGQTP
jgi:hypothetical protein